MNSRYVASIRRKICALQILPLFCIMLLSGCGPVVGYMIAGNAEYQKVEGKDCKAWNYAPSYYQSMSWSGECRNGFATGYGVMTLKSVSDGKEYIAEKECLLDEAGKEKLLYSFKDNQGKELKYFDATEVKNAAQQAQAKSSGGYSVCDSYDLVYYRTYWGNTSRRIGNPCGVNDLSPDQQLLILHYENTTPQQLVKDIERHLQTPVVNGILKTLNNKYAGVKLAAYFFGTHEISQDGSRFRGLRVVAKEPYYYKSAHDDFFRDPGFTVLQCNKDDPINCVRFELFGSTLSPLGFPLDENLIAVGAQYDDPKGTRMFYPLVFVACPGRCERGPALETIDNIISPGVLADTQSSVTRYSWKCESGVDANALLNALKAINIDSDYEAPDVWYAVQSIQTQTGSTLKAFGRAVVEALRADYEESKNRSYAETVQPADSDNSDKNDTDQDSSGVQETKTSNAVSGVKSRSLLPANELYKIFETSHPESLTAYDTKCKNGRRGLIIFNERNGKWWINTTDITIFLETPYGSQEEAEGCLCDKICK